MPQIDSHLTAKLYVDNAIDETLLVRNNKDNDFFNYNLTNSNSITSNTQAENDNEVITKAYVDQFHQENEQARQDLGICFYNESNDLVKDNHTTISMIKKVTNLDSITVTRNPNSDNQSANKKYVDDSLGSNNSLGINQTLENYLKVSLRNDTYNLTKYNKIQITDTTEIKFPNIGGDLLQKWNIKCNNKNNQSRITDFIKSTKTKSPTGRSGASSLPPIGNALMYIETSSNVQGKNVFVSFERTDIIQISNVSFYHNRFSLMTNDSKKSIGRFKFQLLLHDSTWSTRYNIPKNDRYSNSSNQWTLVNINFTVENYGIKLIYDQIDTPHADMCFSNITITHSVY